MYGQQENTLWTEAFRPDSLDGYIGNEHIIEKVKIFIDQWRCTASIILWISWYG
jgi:Holliday junction resolvasome RuvABC ATP-dependent DNA helicase subunit